MADDNDFRAFLIETEKESKKMNEALKNYKPIEKELTVNDGTVIYFINGYYEGTCMDIDDILDDIEGNYTPPITDGQYYTLEKGILKVSINKKGKTKLTMCKATVLDEQLGKSAWGPMYPGGPTETNIFYGNRAITANRFNDDWFVDYDLAKAKFDDNVKNGYEYKF